jgi:hypothetical protein
MRLVLSGAPRSLSPAQHALAATTVGLGVLSYTTLLLGLLDGLTPPLVWVILMVLMLALALPGSDNPGRAVASAWRRMATTIRQPDGWAQAAVVWIVLAAGINLIAALAPPLGADDLAYHFSIPQRYLDAGGIHFMPDKYRSNLPLTMEMVWTLAMGIGDGSVAQVVNWAIALLAVGWVVMLAAEVGTGRRQALLAGGLFYSTSTVGALSGSGSAELGGTVFVLGCVFLLLRWRAARSTRWLALAGILAGLYAGTKLPHALAALVLTAWVLIVDLRGGRGAGEAARSAATFFLAATAVVGVWYAKTWLATGNPAYPFLRQVFGGPAIRTELLADDSFSYRVAPGWAPNLTAEHPLWRLLIQPYRLVVAPGLVRGHVSPLFVALLPVVVWSAIRERGRLLSLLGLALVLYVYWAPTYPLVRIGLPVVALMSVPTAQAVFAIARRGGLPRGVMLAGLLAWGVTSMAGSVREAVPVVGVILGRQTVDQYLLARGPSKFAFDAYDAYLFMNRTFLPNAHILLWEPRGYYLRRPYTHAAEFVQTMADPALIYDPRYVKAELQRFGITHVAMTDNYLRQRLRETLEASGRLRCLFQGRSMVVCALD